MYCRKAGRLCWCLTSVDLKARQSTSQSLCCTKWNAGLCSLLRENSAFSANKETCVARMASGIWGHSKEKQRGRIAELLGLKSVWICAKHNSLQLVPLSTSLWGAAAYSLGTSTIYERKRQDRAFYDGWQSRWNAAALGWRRGGKYWNQSMNWLFVYSYVFVFSVLYGYMGSLFYAASCNNWEKHMANCWMFLQCLNKNFEYNILKQTDISLG